MKTNFITVKHDSSIKLTEEQCKILGIDLNKDEIIGELKTVGVWNIAKSYKTICIDTLYTNVDGFIKPIEVTFFGVRTMINIRQSGYGIEGYVSIGGKKYTCFDSSVLVECGEKLINVAVISARFTEYPKN